MFILYADKTKLTVRQQEPITSGSVNVYKVRFEFSEDWEGLDRVAIFRTDRASKDVLIRTGETCVLPWEVLRVPGMRLKVGVSGKKDNETVLPTVWASLGMILEGVASESTALPSPEYEIGHGLKVEDGKLVVNSVNDFAGDNTLPMTAAGVQTVVGNIEALLGTI